MMTISIHYEILVNDNEYPMGWWISQRTCCQSNIGFYNNEHLKQKYYLFFQYTTAPLMH